MKFQIVLASEAVDDFKALSAHAKAEVRDAIEAHLRHEPTKMSKSRIKRLRGLSRPQYRLRVGEIRTYYDVSASTVEVLGIIEKDKSKQWLEKAGESQ